MIVEFFLLLTPGFIGFIGLLRRLFIYLLSSGSLRVNVD